MQRREKGSGTVFYDKARKKWRGRIIVGFNYNGSVKTRSVSASTKTVVKQKLEEIRISLNEGTYTDMSNVTIPELATIINEEKMQTNIIKESSYCGNKDTIKLIQNSVLGKIPVQKIDSVILTNYFNTFAESYSNSMIEKVYLQVSQALKKAIRMRVIVSNPLDDVIRPKSKRKSKKVRSLTIEEQKAFVSALNAEKREPYRTMLLTELYLGLRMGEISAISIDDFSLKFKTVHIHRTISRDKSGRAIVSDTTKSKAGDRKLHLSDTICELWSDYLDNHYVPNKYGLMFVTNKTKRPFYSGNVNAVFKEIITKYKIGKPEEFNQHMLRHTFGTRCIEAGMQPTVLQRIMGHEDISVTINTYCDILDFYQSKCIEKAQDYLEENGLKLSS